MRARLPPDLSPRPLELFKRRISLQTRNERARVEPAVPRPIGMHVDDGLAQGALRFSRGVDQAQGAGQAAAVVAVPVGEMHVFDGAEVCAGASDVFLEDVFFRPRVEQKCVGCCGGGGCYEEGEAVGLGDVRMWVGCRTCEWGSIAVFGGSRR